MRRPGLRETIVHTPADADGARSRTLTMEMRLSAAGAVVKNVVFTDDCGEVCFANFDASQLAPADWGILRLTARGADTADAAAAVSFLTDGAVIMVR